MHRNFAHLRASRPDLHAIVVEGYCETMAYGRPHWADSVDEYTESYSALLCELLDNRLNDSQEEMEAGAWACGRDMACARMAARDARRDDTVEA